MRGEIEVAYLAPHTLSRVRAPLPRPAAEQELWALLTVYQALRTSDRHRRREGLG